MMEIVNEKNRMKNEIRMNQAKNSDEEERV